MIKAVFLDFDGTIYSHATKKIPDSACDAIKIAQANNIKIFIASGRHLDEIKQFDIKNLKFDGYVLTNGQLLLDKNCEIISANCIEGKEKEMIIEEFNNKETSIMIRDVEEEFINFVDDYTRAAYKSVDSPVPVVKEYQNGHMLVATVFLNSDEAKKRIFEKFKNLSITYWYDGSIDMVSKGMNKMKGILKMLELNNIKIDEIVTIGDGENDVEMIQSCPNGVAMGNSCDSVKEVANYITTDIDKDGLKNAFIKYNII